LAIIIRGSHDRSLHCAFQLLRNLTDKTGIRTSKMHDMHLENGSSLGNFLTFLVGTLSPTAAHGIRIAHMGNISVQSRRRTANSKRRRSL